MELFGFRLFMREYLSFLISLEIFPPLWLDGPFSFILLT